MRIYRLKLRFCYSRCNTRPWFRPVLGFSIAVNLFVASILLPSIINNYEKGILSFKSFRTEDDRSERKQSQTQESDGENYQNYFRIDYTIIESTCKPHHWFNTTKTKSSILTLTKEKINMITKTSLADVDIITLNPIIKRVTKTEPSSSNKLSETMCDYVIQLHIGFNFPIDCNDTCQSEELNRLTSVSKPFGDPVNQSFAITLYSSSVYPLFIYLDVYQVSIHQSSIYFNRQVHIVSFNNNHYISALIIDSSALQTSIVISQIDRTLFLITDSLDEAIVANNPSQVYISLSLVSIPNMYLRHSFSRVRLEKNDESILFKQDATFKLLMSRKKPNMIAFQAINLPSSYITVDPETKTALIIVPTEQEVYDVDYLDEKFLFKFDLN